MRQLIIISLVLCLVGNEVVHLLVAHGFHRTKEMADDLPLHAFGDGEARGDHGLHHAVELGRRGGRDDVVHALYAHAGGQAIGHAGGEELHRSVDDDEAFHRRLVELVVHRRGEASVAEAHHVEAVGQAQARERFVDLLRLELDREIARGRNALAEIDKVGQDKVEVLRERPDLAAPVAARIGAHAMEHEQVRLARLLVIADVQQGLRAGHEGILLHVMLQMLAGVFVLPVEKPGLLALGHNGSGNKEKEEGAEHGVKVGGNASMEVRLCMT